MHREIQPDEYGSIREKYGLRADDIPIRETKTLCPHDYRILDGVIFERDSKVYIRRICPEHGEIEEIYWSDASLYRKVLRYRAPPRRIRGTNTPLSEPCPFSCGLCPIHMNQTALANIVATNRCDLSCWYCFFYAEKAGFVYEPSIEEIVGMVRILRKQGPYTPSAVQITGGEPLLRDDIIDLVRAIRNEGIIHVQLNTNGLRIARMWWNNGKGEAVRFVSELRRAGVNTVYLSFDGVTPKSNPKNHWEIPFILDAFYEGGLTSVVFVPCVIPGVNTEELGDIIRTAALNMRVVRGVNFQPVSITGSVPREERKKIRITIPDVLRLIEKQTDGQIGREAWYPVPWTYGISRFIEEITEKNQIVMVNDPACGVATYVYPHIRKKNGKKIVDGYTPITDFVDVEALYDYFLEKAEYLAGTRGIRRKLRKIRVALSLMWNIGKFINYSRAPKELNIKKTIRSILFRHNYDALGKFHYKMLYLGMMHFMDLYNYDIGRVMRCNIHYLVPDGRLIPFCAFNVLSDIYRDKIQKQYSYSIEQWVKLKGEKSIGPEIKHKRDIDRIRRSMIYQEFYGA